MKRAGITILIAGLLLALLLLLRESPAAQSTDVDAAVTDAVEPTERPAATNAATDSVNSDLDTSESNGGVDQHEALNEVEAGLLDMYASVVDGFIAHRGNCREMAIAVEEATAEYDATLVRWQKDKGAMSADAYAKSQAKVEAAAGERLAAIRHEIEQGVARCKDDPRLRNALKGLASVGVER